MLRHFCDYDRVQLKHCAEYVIMNNPYIGESHKQNTL